MIAFAPGLLLVFHGLVNVEEGLRLIRVGLVQGDQEVVQRGQDLVQGGPGLVQFGYQWMFAVGGLFLLRLLLDPVMVRRPLLEPNLNAGGLTFTGTAMLVFLIANVLANRPPERLEHKLLRQEGAWDAAPATAPSTTWPASAARPRSPRKGRAILSRGSKRLSPAWRPSPPSWPSWWRWS